MSCELLSGNPVTGSVVSIDIGPGNRKLICILRFARTRTPFAVLRYVSCAAGLAGPRPEMAAATDGSQSRNSGFDIDRFV